MSQLVLDILLASRAKPYPVRELKVALRAIGRPLPYLDQLKRQQILDRIPEWLTQDDQNRLFRELKARSKAA